MAWVYDPHSDEEGCFGWCGERLERLEEIRVKDDKAGEEAGETGKPEPVGGIQDDGEIFEAKEPNASEVGPPGWLGWVLTICSHLLLMVLAFVATWIFFPRSIFFFIDTQRGVIQQAPPGTRLNPDGTLSIPGVTDVPLPPANGRRGPTTSAPPASPAAQSPKDGKDSKDRKDQKDPNAPRK